MVPASLLPHLYQLLEAWACSRRWCPEQRLGTVQNHRRAFRSDILYLDSSLGFLNHLTRWMTATSDTTYTLLATPTPQPPYRTAWGRGQTQQTQTVKSYGRAAGLRQPAACWRSWERFVLHEFSQRVRFDCLLFSLSWASCCRWYNQPSSFCFGMQLLFGLKTAFLWMRVTVPVCTAWPPFFSQHSFQGVQSLRVSPRWGLQ